MNYLILQTPLGAGKTQQDFPFVFSQALDPAAVITALRTIPGLEDALVIGGGQALSVHPQCEGGFASPVVKSRVQLDTEVFMGMYVTNGILRKSPDEEQVPPPPPPP